MSPSDPNGILTNDTIDSWSDLAKLLDFFSRYNGRDWLFRGVTRQSYALIPSVGRPGVRKLKPGTSSARLPYSEKDEKASFRQFVDMARPYIGKEPKNEIEWLAIAQHYGLQTRFLDWTESLLIAVWFAIQKVEATATLDLSNKRLVVTSEDPAIWVVRDVARVSDVEREAPFSIVKPKSYRPPHIDKRIGAQRSVFTIHGAPTKEFKVKEMWKFTISAKRFFLLQKRIDACGVNERSLFPDLAGVAKDVAWRYKNNWLVGYRIE